MTLGTICKKCGGSADAQTTRHGVYVQCLGCGARYLSGSKAELQRFGKMLAGVACFAAAALTLFYGFLYAIYRLSGGK